MSSLAHWIPKFEPPNMGLWVAVFLELAMLTELMTHRAIFGIVMWIGYFYFSATRSVIFHRDE